MPVVPQAPPIKGLPVVRRGLGREILGGLTDQGVQACRSERTAGPATAIFVLATVGVAGLQQGGFFTRGQIAAGALLAAAVLTALPVRRAAYPDLRFPLVAGGLLAGWTLIRAVPDGSLTVAGREALLLIGLATVLMLCIRLNRAAQHLVLAGLLGLGVLLAIIGWAGVVWRLTPWALPTQGLWRAASTITYANATAAVLVPLAVTVLALLSTQRRSVPLGLVLTVLLLGIGTTLSRAGALALLVGVAVVLLARGWIVLRVLLGPLAGAIVALAGLLPSLPVAAQPRPWLAVAALAGGLGLTAVLVSGARRRAAGAALAFLLSAAFLVSHSVVGWGSFREAGLRVWHHRVNVASPNRSATNAAALRLFARHPLTGVGPGRVVLESRDKGRLRVQLYVHDEYLQVLAEVGAIGAALLAALIAGTARLLWRSRPREPGAALWAGVLAACAAAAVGAGFDFVWHVPVVPLTMAVLVGLAVAPAASTNEGGLRERRSL
jgi:hypothetical protein